MQFRPNDFSYLNLHFLRSNALQLQNDLLVMLKCQNINYSFDCKSNIKTQTRTIEKNIGS